MAKKPPRRSPVDRRRHPREFFIAGWDPYIVSLKERDQAGKSDEDEVEEEEAALSTSGGRSRRRTSLLKKK